ncbi:MAG TPA: methyltransferase domain-containing protein, partial [Methanosarcina sp.]|nr:methyltransferase domain-containing protein [Methanosarcina sp.]
MRLRTKSILLFFLILAILFWWRRGKGIHRHPIPCPSWFIWGLENPYTQAVAGSALLLERLELKPGMKVLDVGSGPGRLSIPAAERVGPEGWVLALDIQPAMLDKLKKRAETKKLGNIQTVLGGIGEGLLEKNAFDRALLVTVLGEISDRKAALDEIYVTLKPGGILSITEVIPDPHYQSKDTVRSLAESVGFCLKHQYCGGLAFT